MKKKTLATLLFGATVLGSGLAGLTGCGSPVTHHDAIPATCYETGTKEYWEKDGKFYLDKDCTIEVTEADLIISKLIHDYVDDICNACQIEHVARVEATCYNAGNIEYWKKGGKFYSDNQCNNEIAAGDVVIAQLSHRFSDGVCSHCGLEHVARVEATCYTTGNIEYWKKAGRFYSDDQCQTEIQENETVLAKLSHSFNDGVCSHCGNAQMQDYYVQILGERPDGDYDNNTKYNLPALNMFGFTTYDAVKDKAKFSSQVPLDYLVDLTAYASQIATIAPTGWVFDA